MRWAIVFAWVLSLFSAARAELPPNPAEQIDAPAYWLRATVAHCTAPATQPQQRDLVDAVLPLASVGQMRVGDIAGARQSALVMLQHAKEQPAPSQRAMAFCEVANLQYQLLQMDEYRKSVAAAQKASEEMPDDFLRPMVSLRLATLLDRTGDDSDADDIPRSTRDLERKAKLYCALALEAAARKDRPLLSKRLMRAAATAEGQDDTVSSRILNRVGRTYAELGDFDSARITIESITDPASRSDVYGALARYQMKAHDPRGYRDSVAKARDAIVLLPPADRAWRCILLAYEQQEAGDREGTRLTLNMAARTIEHMDDLQARAKAYFDLADAVGRLGDATNCLDALDKAEAALKDAPSPEPGMLDPRLGRYSDIACSLAKAGKMEAAERVINRIPPGEDRSVAWAALAVAEADAGHVERSLALLEGVHTPAARCRLCRRIGEAYTRQGDFGILQKWITTLSTPAERAYACMGGAEGLLDRRVVELSPAEVAELIDP